MGGTFMSLPLDYRDYFVRNLHDALSGHSSASVHEAVRFSEQSRTKCIGLTIETRPDYCLTPHLTQVSFPSMLKICFSDIQMRCYHLMFSDCLQVLSMPTASGLFWFPIQTLGLPFDSTQRALVVLCCLALWTCPLTNSLHWYILLCSHIGEAESCNVLLTMRLSQTIISHRLPILIC